MSAPKLPWEEKLAPLGSAPELADLESAAAALNSSADQDELARSATIADVHDIVSRADIQPAIDAAEKAAEDILRNKIAGHDVVIATTNMSGQTIKLNDAKNRALRTLFQNLGVDLLVAMGTVLPMLLNMDFTDKTAWIIFGSSVAKTIVGVFVSYVSRLAVEPVIPTPVETPTGQVVQPLLHAPR